MKWVRRLCFVYSQNARGDVFGMEIYFEQISELGVSSLI
jgi:hypothetical protein